MSKLAAVRTYEYKRSDFKEGVVGWHDWMKPMWISGCFKPLGVLEINPDAICTVEWKPNARYTHYKDVYDSYSGVDIPCPHYEITMADGTKLLVEELPYESTRLHDARPEEEVGGSTNNAQELQG